MKIAPIIIFILLSCSCNAQLFKRVPRIIYKDTVIYKPVYKSVITYKDSIVWRPVFVDSTIIRTTVKDSMFFIPVYVPEAIKNATINYKITIK